MDDLDDGIDFTDPIAAVFDLSEEMVERALRIGWIVAYAFYAGIGLTGIAALGLLFLLSSFQGTQSDFILVAFAAATLVVSPIVVWFARRERQFLLKYRVLSSSANRARDWEAQPEIPEGNTPLERLISYLREEDDRFAHHYEKRPQALKMPAEVTGKSKVAYSFDAYFARNPWPWERIPDGFRLLVRVIAEADLEDVERLREEAEDGLSFVDAPPSGARIILLQTDRSDFSEEVVDYVNENEVEYERLIGSETWDWSSPIELVAEDLDMDVYSFGNYYFG